MRTSAKHAYIQHAFSLMIEKGLTGKPVRISTPVQIALNDEYSIVRGHDNYGPCVIVRARWDSDDASSRSISKEIRSYKLGSLAQKSRQILPREDP